MFVYFFNTLILCYIMHRLDLAVVWTFTIMSLSSMYFTFGKF